MDSPKYFIIITLVEGQNFAVPDGAPDKIEATVFAEARFGNESILRSDPIKLVNSNPEFVTELAWQLDKKSLHQLRVERRAIKLQVFMQTRDKKRFRQSESRAGHHGSDDTESNRIELIGYTIIDIRSAQERESPKFQWLPLLNPKFRKPSYNRPEIQLALTLSRIEEGNCSKDDSELPADTTILISNTVNGLTDSQSSRYESAETNGLDNLNDSNQLYRTCLDVTSDHIERNEIIDNDIQIHSRGGRFYVYDAHDPEKFTIDDCNEAYRITISIPFNSDLESLSQGFAENYHFSAVLFGSQLRTETFEKLSNVGTKEIVINIYTTYPSILATYFDLNPSFIIKLYQDNSGHVLGIATVQIDQLCSIDARRRSIEGIFALQPTFDEENPSSNPSIGVSIVLEKIETELMERENFNDEYSSEILNNHFAEDFDELIPKTFHDSHQLTLEETNQDLTSHQSFQANIRQSNNERIRQDRHFCFTIDLKKFTYTQDQRMIPTLRELVVRYSYPFFGYKDTITTDASLPIGPTNSIIVSGFCEFNFATTYESLIAALDEIPLHLDILSCDSPRRIDLNTESERIVATCDLNLAEILGLSTASPEQLESPLSKTISAPIYGLNGSENGQLQVYLSLQDRGQPAYETERPDMIDVLDASQVQPDLPNNKSATITKSSRQTDQRKMDSFMEEIRASIEDWKEKCSQRLTDEMRNRENERFRRILQRFEAKDSKREQEFKEKVKALNQLERKFHSALSNVESLEKMLSNSFEQLRTKDSLLDSKLESIDLKISKAVNDVQVEFDKRLNFYPAKYSRSADDNLIIKTETQPKNSIESSKNFSKVGSSSDSCQARRSSLKNTANHISGGIPLPVRSSSLVRGVVDGSLTKFVTKPPGVTTLVVNGVNPKARSNSVASKLNLSKETQEKLASLRREKAELLKRGCRPNDELIREINSLIEKLAC